MNSYLPLRICEGRSPRDLVREESNGRPETAAASSTFQRRPSGDDQESAIVQFAEARIYAPEEVEDVTIALMRIDGYQDRCSVAWETFDPTGTNSNVYVHSTGVVTFLPTEHTKTITVKVVSDNTWSANAEFNVRLSEPDNCRLGQYQHTCRVKIIDADFFPDNKHKEAFAKGEMDGENGFDLLVSYLKFNLKVPGVAWRVAVLMVLDQIHNAYFLMTTYLNIYMVDVVFKLKKGEGGGEGEAEEAVERRLVATGIAILRRLMEGERGEEGAAGEGGEEEEPELFGGFLVNGSREESAIMCALLYIVPLLLLHISDIVKVQLNVVGRSREYLQRSLFIKYLHYSEMEQRKTVPVSIGIGVITEAAEIAEMGFMKAVAMLRLFCKMLIVGNFVHMEQPSAVLPMVGLGALTFLWVALWLRYLIHHAVEVVEQEKSVMEAVHSTAINYRLVADYHKRPLQSDLFSKKAQALTRAKNNQEFGLLNSRYFFTWVATCTAGAFIMTRADKVLSAEVSLGTFLAMLKIIFELGGEFQEVFDEVVEMVRTIGPLRIMIRYLNADTDMMTRHAESGRRHQEMQRNITWLHEKGNLNFDLIPIALHNIAFQYPKKAGDASHFTLRQEGKLSVPQGSMVGVIGQHQSGKSTLMQLLGNVLDVEDGFIFVPPHLRILHVAQTPMLFAGTLVKNLAYGVAGQDVDAVIASSHDKIRKIAQILEFDPMLQEMLEKDMAGPPPSDTEKGGFGEKQWAHSLSAAQVALINFARAMIASPNVLVVHRPTQMFNKDQQVKIMMILRQFVQNRGVGMDGQVSHRRPRTVFYSSDRFKEHGFADQIWEVRDGIVRCIRPEPAADLPALQTKN